ncbi:transposase family protein [Microbispora sp. H10885]|uniref:transposase family protein n=1 Tax=Microbispora sp. H10885 TaxID=2729110 RepID=UPI0037C55940
MQAACPRCGTVSHRVHRSYERRVCDTAVGGQETILHLRIRRFRCGNDACAAKTFRMNTLTPSSTREASIRGKSAKVAPRM